MILATFKSSWEHSKKNLLLVKGVYKEDIALVIEDSTGTHHTINIGNTPEEAIDLLARMARTLFQKPRRGKPASETEQGKLF